jgi:hypothetical protein
MAWMPSERPAVTTPFFVNGAIFSSFFARGRLPATLPAQWLAPLRA